MELLVKLYQDQPPRIGIKHVYEYQAVKSYEELVRRMGTSEVRAVLELSSNKVDLTLSSSFNGLQTRYKGLDFKADDLQKLRTLDPSSSVTFVHVFPHHNTIMVAKPFRKASFLCITGLELRGADFAAPGRSL